MNCYICKDEIIINIIQHKCLCGARYNSFNINGTEIVVCYLNLEKYRFMISQKYEFNTYNFGITIINEFNIDIYLNNKRVYYLDVDRDKVNIKYLFNLLKTLVLK